MMRKILLFLAGSCLILASCDVNSNQEAQDQAKARIDSSVNAKISQQQAALANKNDSIINALAKKKAEEMEADNRKHTNTNIQPGKTTKSKADTNVRHTQ